MPDLSFFQFAPLPLNHITGHYDIGLVALSYVMAFFASYISMDFAGRLRIETNPKTKLYWLAGGAFSMGAGIWSMHFIGMLAFIMPMQIAYDPGWTASSLCVAILSSGVALYTLRHKQKRFASLLIGGIILGLGIASMHYMGMTGMLGMKIRYLPSIFIFSILIAIAGSEGALWFMIVSNKGTFTQQIRAKLLSALIMGAAICGMHYTGMAAAVFTPSATHLMHESINVFDLSFYVSCITGIILISALIVSTYKQLLSNAVTKEKFFLNAIINNLPDGVLACDPQGHVIIANTALKKLTNLDFTQKDWLKSFVIYPINHNQPLNFSKHPVLRALRGEYMDGFEFELRLKNFQTPRKVLICSQPLLNMDHENIGVVFTMSDITLQKNISSLLMASNRELDAFTYSVAHDLKSPLRAIDGFSKILATDYSKQIDQEGLRLIDIICANAVKMGQLIEDLLAFSQLNRHKIKKTPLNMQQLVKEVYNEMTEGLSLQVNFVLQDLPNCHADLMLIRKVWINLLSNSLKFTQNNPDACIEIGSMMAKDEITYYIKDNGIGFDMKYADKLFGIFQRLHSHDIEGTGIGLANVARIIQLHGGHVYAEGNPQKGATFYFTLPRPFDN